MEIEKINENQIKIVLEKSDLKERNIKIGELAYGSEKTQELFRDMMQKAMLECDFHTENTPLMIEAIPMSAESIIIIVTKVSNPEDIENKFNLFNSQKEPTKYKKKSVSKKKNNPNTDNIIIYSFDNLDMLVDVSIRLDGLYKGQSSVYKYKNRFYLVLELINDFLISSEDLDYILFEYGAKHKGSIISKYFLIEHGELFIKKNALSVILKYLK